MMRSFHPAFIIWLIAQCRSSFQTPVFPQLHRSLHPSNIEVTYEIPGVRIDDGVGDFLLKALTSEPKGTSHLPEKSVTTISLRPEYARNYVQHGRYVRLQPKKYRGESVLSRSKKKVQRFGLRVTKNLGLVLNRGSGTGSSQEKDFNIEVAQLREHFRMYGNPFKDSTVEAELLDQAKGLPILQKFLGEFHKKNLDQRPESQEFVDTLIKKAFLYLLLKPNISDREGELWIKTFAYIMNAGHPDPLTASRESIVQHGLLSLHSKLGSKRQTLQQITSSLSLVLTRRLENAKGKASALETHGKAWVSEILEPSWGLSQNMRMWKSFKQLIQDDTKLSACLAAFSQEDESLMAPWITELERICYKDSQKTSSETRTAAVAFLYHIGFNNEMSGVPERLRLQAQTCLQNLHGTSPHSQLLVHTQLFILLDKILEPGYA